MLKLKNTWVSGDSDDLRSFFNGLCDSLLELELKQKDEEDLEGKYLNLEDEYLGLKAHCEDLEELVRELQEEIEQYKKQLEGKPARRKLVKK